MEITRRTLLGSALAGAAVSQTPPPSPSSASPSPNWFEVSVEANQRNAVALAKIPLPQATEPAFSFKA